MPGSLDVLVGVCHVQAFPNVFSVFLWGEDDIAAPVSWFISYIFNDVHFLSFVENLIKLVFER